VFDRRYQCHSQGKLPGALQHQELVTCDGYSARPKTAVMARQTVSAWVGAGLAKLYPGAGIPLQDSSIAEAGYGQPAYLGQPHPL